VTRTDAEPRTPPHSFEWGDEQGAVLRTVLRQGDVEPTGDLVERLSGAVQASMARFQPAVSPTRRERHDAVRALLRLAEAADPQVGLIRKRVAALPSSAIAEATIRACELWPRVFRGESLDDGFDFAAWCQTARPEQLLEAVRTFFSDGGVVVQGRARPSGKRSKPQLEPVILGQVRGAAGGYPGAGAAVLTDAPDHRSPSAGGRPPADAADTLVMWLAVDWVRVTGRAPQPGRSDQTAFGGLVHHVFGWLGLETAEQSLRRYWETVEDAEIIEIEGGQIFR
jgi:hypothetical protein